MLCESVGKIKGVGQLAIAKMNELRIHTIADLQIHVRHCGKVHSKNGTITGKRCPVFEYTGKKIVTIGAYKKETIKEFARVRQLTLSSSKWI